jgi:phospholipase C
MPAPHPSGIEHVVIVMMENRSFDHFLGWHPTADAQQEGLSYQDGAGAVHNTFALAPDYMGCGHPDPDHSFDGSRVATNGGAMDGFLRAGMNDLYAIGYYTEADRPFFNALARNYTTLDRMFGSILGPTFPNRMFHYAAQTDRLENTTDPADMPTIFDRLDDADVSARVYIKDFSLVMLWGTKYLDITESYDQFLDDAEEGNLRSVSFVEPRFRNDAAGTTGSDHPYGDVRKGDAFLAETFDAVSRSPNWPSTIFIVTYDESGGFFDHVPPPRAAAPNDVDPDIVDGKTQLGMRVPAVIASPFTRGDPGAPRVVSTVYDHTSILKFIEWRWGLAPLTARDASSDIGDLVDALDLANPDPTLPLLPLPMEPEIMECEDPPVSDEIAIESVMLLDDFNDFFDKVFDGEFPF